MKSKILILIACCLLPLTLTGCPPLIAGLGVASGVGGSYLKYKGAIEEAEALREVTEGLKEVIREMEENE